MLAMVREMARVSPLRSKMVPRGASSYRADVLIVGLLLKTGAQPPTCT